MDVFQVTCGTSEDEWMLGIAASAELGMELAQEDSSIPLAWSTYQGGHGQVWLASCTAYRYHVTAWPLYDPNNDIGPRAFAG